MLVTKILQPHNLITGIASAVERATVEALGIKSYTAKLDKKRIDRAERILELLVSEGILGTDEEKTFEPDSVGSTGDIR